MEAALARFLLPKLQPHGKIGKATILDVSGQKVHHGQDEKGQVSILVSNRYWGLAHTGETLVNVTH